MSARKTFVKLIIILMALVMSTSIISCQTSSSLPAPVPASTTASTLAIPQEPTTSKEYYERGIKLKDKQQFAQALLAFSKAIELDSNYAEAYYERSKLVAYEGEWDKTIGNCNKAISFNANYLEAYYIRGLARMKKTLYDGAIADLNMAIGMETSKREMDELKKVTNLIIPPGELILLYMRLSYGGGKDCRGNYMPYNNTLQLQLFVNPGDSRVEIDKIYLDPPVGGRAEIDSPIRYFDSLGLQYLVTCISSEYPTTSAPTCRIDYKSKSGLVNKKSNEVSNAKIIVEPGELICPTD